MCILFCNTGLTLKGFEVLRDNIITVAMAMLLREACYVHVLQHSTVNVPRNIIVFENLVH
jgi:hypothetical protein